MGAALSMKIPLNLLLIKGEIWNFPPLAKEFTRGFLSVGVNTTMPMIVRHGLTETPN